MLFVQHPGGNTAQAWYEFPYKGLVNTTCLGQVLFPRTVIKAFSRGGRFCKSEIVLAIRVPGPVDNSIAAQGLRIVAQRGTRHILDDNLKAAVG